MVEKLSIIAFSKDDIDKVGLFVRDLENVASEIVLVDSSDKKNSAKLSKISKKNKKLRIFHVVPIGYPDPLFMYAVNQCKNKWVLYLDTDERLSPDLRSGIKSLISDAHCSAYAIRRYEEVRNGDRGKFFTWQVHLFKKNSVSFKGLIHEQPKVKGTTENVEDDTWYIEHVTELMEHEKMEYHRMEKYERFCYRQYNERVLDYFSKALVPNSKSVIKSAVLGVVRGWMRFYEYATLREMENEISNFDYKILYLLKNSAYKIKAGEISRLPEVLSSASRYMKRLKAWRNEPDGDENFQISKVINDAGITKFLKLDKQQTINRLNSRYGKSDTKGLKLLTHLLTDEYRLRHTK